MTTLVEGERRTVVNEAQWDSPDFYRALPAGAPPPTRRSSRPL
jgi:hypothetical protein